MQNCSCSMVCKGYICPHHMGDCKAADSATYAFPAKQSSTTSMGSASDFPSLSKKALTLTSKAWRVNKIYSRNSQSKSAIPLKKHFQLFKLGYGNHLCLLQMNSLQLPCVRACGFANLLALSCSQDLLLFTLLFAVTRGQHADICILPYKMVTISATHWGTQI